MLLACLGLLEATHKTTPLATSTVWLGLLFDYMAMAVTLPPEKLQEVLDLATRWASKQSANLHELQVLLGKRLYMAQVCHSAQLFRNRMLENVTPHPHGFHPSVTWFWQTPPVVPAFPSQH